MTLKKKFTSDVLFYGISSGLMSLFGFITLPILTKTLSQELYGVWVQIMITTSLLLPFITVSFQVSVVRFLAGNENKQRVSSLFHSMLGIVFLNSLLFVLITFIFKDTLSSFIFGDPSFRTFVPLLGLWIMAEAIYIMSTSFMRAKNKIKLLSLVNIGYAIPRILILYLVLVIFGGDIRLVLILYIITSIVFSLLVYLLEVVRTVGVFIEMHNLKRTLKDLLKFSLPFIPNGILMWVLASSDRYFIVHLLSLSENAVYSAAYSLTSVLSLFYMPLGFVVYPLLVEFWEKGQKDIVRTLFEKSTRIYIFLVVPAIFGLYTLGPKLILILTTSDYTVSPAIILWISVGILFLGIYQINVYIIHLIKKTYYNTIIFFTAAIINVVLNYILIKAIGIEGAAISTLISYLFLASVIAILARKEIHYAFDIKLMIKCIFASLIMFFVIKQIAINDIFTILIIIILGFSVYVILSIILKSITQEDINDIKHVLGFDKS
jgi:O-antigen/teichoic acid export membrane protein